jgi:hypothetical protein
MSALDYTVEPEVGCSDSNANYAAFIRAAAMIRGRDAVEEFLACLKYLLTSSFGFRDVTIDMTPISKVRTPLLLFPVEAVSVENADHFLT